MKGGLAGNVEDNLDCQHERLAAEAKARHEAVLLAARIEGAKAMQKAVAYVVMMKGNNIDELEREILTIDPASVVKGGE